MPISPDQIRQTPASVRSGAAERIIAFLRSRYPTKTADNVAADTGLGAPTVQTWIDRCTAPNIVGIIALTSAYGPDFLTACMGERAPAWLSAAHREAEAARIDREIEELKARRASLRA